jgi:hypothetical protein
MIGKDSRPKLTVAIISSGATYQHAAALGAATNKMSSGATNVYVYRPKHEKSTESLLRLSREYGFRIKSFEMARVSDRKYTSQLKCQGFYQAVCDTPPGGLLLLVDADTCCKARLSFSATVTEQILAGGIGLVPDTANRHTSNPKEWSYVKPERRLQYVNSGVILTSAEALPLFARFRDMAVNAEFLCGPFNDQTIINYALAQYFPSHLVILDKRYNGLRSFLSPKTLITHCAGGAGGLRTGGFRERTHTKMCLDVLAAKETEFSRLRRLRTAFYNIPARRQTAGDAPEGEGIVTCAAESAIASLFFLLSSVRHFGCSKPIEIWHRKGEWTEEAKVPLIREFGARFLEVSEGEARDHANFRTHYRARAIVASSFARVLYLDSDNLLLADPTPLFNAPQFEGHGAIFWRGSDKPHFKPLRRLQKAFRILSSGPTNFEASQMLIDRVRWSAALNRAIYISDNYDSYSDYLRDEGEILKLSFDSCADDYLALPTRFVTIGQRRTHVSFEQGPLFCYIPEGCSKFVTLAETFEFPTISKTIARNWVRAFRAMNPGCAELLELAEVQSLCRSRLPVRRDLLMRKVSRLPTTLLRRGRRTLPEESVRTF